MPDRRRLAGSRVLCVSRGQLLLVEHYDPATGNHYWVLPGGGREARETFAEAAIREVREETGIAVRIVRRLRVPAGQADATCALFLAAPIEHQPPLPQVDLANEAYLRGAAWHPIAPDSPLGPLGPAYWGYLAPHIGRLLAAPDNAPATVATEGSPRLSL